MRRRHRVAVGFFIAICGIAIAFGSELGWVSARGTRPATGITHTSLQGLLHWTYTDTSSYLKSFGFAVLVAGILVFIGGIFGSRLVAGLFSLLALVASGIWFGLYVNKYSSVNLPYTDLRIGAILVAAGGVLALISTSFLRRRL